MSEDEPGAITHEASLEPVVAPGGEDALDDLPVIDRALYVFHGEIDAGGIGRVLRATDRRLNRTVAIKQLRRADPRSVARFRREMAITARLEHPSIIPIYEVGRWPDGEPFCAMRFVEGQSLRALVLELDDPERRLGLLPVVAAAADAIAHAHDRGVIHRDLTPANIMVGRAGEAVVIDWGLAKRLHDDEPEPGELAPEDAAVTLDGAVMGTPAFMAPEQAAARPVDARSDIYALGAILYHVISGRPPYTGSAAAVIEGIGKGPPPRLDAAPKALCAIVERAMARDPADRHPTASALASDLRRYQAGQPGRARAIVTALGVAAALAAVLGVVSLLDGSEPRPSSTVSGAASSTPPRAPAPPSRGVEDGGLEQKAIAKFARRASCPTDQVTAKPRPDIDPYLALFGDPPPPPADVANDPTRLEVWKSEQEAKAAKWRDSDTIFEMAGCGEQRLYLCNRATTGCQELQRRP